MASRDSDIRAIEQNLREQERRFAEASAELAAFRHQTWSDDRVVGVTVNGHGTLLDLKLAEGALRRPHPAAVGPVITSLILKARDEVREVNRKRLEEILPPSTAPSGIDERQAETPSPPKPAGRPVRRPAPADDEEDFSDRTYLY